MTLHDEKKWEGCSMTRYLTHKAPFVGHRWLSPLRLSILVAVGLITIIASASLAAAAECPVTEESGTVRDMPTWKETTSNILPLTFIMERDIYGGLVPPPVLEVATYMKNNRIAWGNMENQEVAIIGSCLSQDIRESTLFNRAMIGSIDKTRAKVPTKTMKVFALPYNGKRQIHTMRTILPEIKISAREKIPTIIGPVQENRNTNLSGERSVSQAVAVRASTVEFSTLFEGEPFVAVNPIQSAVQLLDNESFRMNRTMTLALHAGNCASGCP
jgi:hypothetical protein